MLFTLPFLANYNGEEYKSKPSLVSLLCCLLFMGVLFIQAMTVEPSAQAANASSNAPDAGLESTNLLSKDDASFAPQSRSDTQGARAQLSASPTPACGLAWRVIPNPSINISYTSSLPDVVAISPYDVWAVGGYWMYPSYGDPLIEHWDGNQWTIEPVPTVPGSVLSAVDAISATDIWAVGFKDNESNTLTMHWDGTSWTHVPSPNVGESNKLLGVSMISSNDVWAVGYWRQTFETDNRTLILHWNGSEWSIVPSPHIGEETTLEDVIAISPTEVWAVGIWYTRATSTHTFTLRWDGIQWSVVPSPDVGDMNNVIHAVTAVSSNDIWALGYYQMRGPGNTYLRTLTLHWDGAQWTHVPSPNASETANNYLWNAVAISSNDVWAVGFYGSDFHNLALHWDGAQWSIVPSPDPGPQSRLLGIDALSSDDLWAVGQYAGSNGRGATQTQRYNDPCQGGTPSPSPTSMVTNTPMGFTPTATAGLPTATPTNCAIQFSDVPSTHTFYQAVRCLACRGIVSGYADGTFRPNNQVTRGQLAKMVSNAAGFSEAVSGQTFQDVPPTNTFYEWIERLTTRGHMTGYACGGPGEPCVGNRPYFRPFANATRGQTAKIVSNAAGFVEPPSGQTFEDVPTSNTFYEFIQRLASRAVMQGYTCGGAGEPCVQPENRPYFRPNNDVTRGQSAKIVANAFYPGCTSP